MLSLCCRNGMLMFSDSSTIFFMDDEESISPNNVLEMTYAISFSDISAMFLKNACGRRGNVSGIYRPPSGARPFAMPSANDALGDLPLVL